MSTQTTCDHCNTVFDPDGPHVEVFDYVTTDDPDDDPDMVREIGLDFCGVACEMAYRWVHASKEHTSWVRPALDLGRPD